MIFFLSSLDYCANYQADSYPCSPTWLPSSVNYQHLPLKFNCLSSQTLLPVSPQESWLSYLHILRNCCRLALFASLPWNSCIEGGKVEFSTGSNGKNWKLHAVCSAFSILTNWWLLIKTIFSGVGGTFYFVLDGEVWVLPLSSGYFWSQEGWKHWHIPPGKGPQVSEVLPNLGVRTLVPPVRGRDHKGPTDSISSVSFRTTLGCCPDQGCP